MLDWADPSFQYDRLAVTKNFTGSPHVDKANQSAYDVSALLYLTTLGAEIGNLERLSKSLPSADDEGGLLEEGGEEESSETE